MAGNSEIKEEYTSSLADLTFNSKPLISVLTILAEENVAQAKDIVEAIETHLSRVRTEVKLPVLYLIDCIIKNVGGPYTALFCQNIVSTFCNVFEQVDERTRAEMFRLRQTWNDVLPPKKLYALDVQIAQLDPAWPVTAPPPSSIHFNPKFLKTTTTTVSSDVTTTPVISKPHTTGLITNTSPANLDPKTLSMQQKLIDKQRELLELQQKKLELELLQTQVKLQEQLKHQNPSALVASGATTATSMPNIIHSQNLLLKPEVAKQLAIPTSTNKSTSNTTNVKSKTGTHTVASVMNAKLQNNQANTVPRIAPVHSSLVNARPIRDPRLLRHQQQQQQNSSAIVNSNVHLESKSKSGTQVTVDSDNKIVNNKTSVRNERIELRLVNNKGNIESHGKSKTSPHSSPLKHTQKIGNSPRKTSKFSRDSKSSSGSLSDVTDLKSSSSSLGSPVKSNRSDPPTKIRSLSKSFKIKKKSNIVRSVDKDISRSETISTSTDKDSISVRYDKSGASFRSDKDSGVLIRAEKKNDKHSKSIKSDKDSKLRKSDVTSFKDLKGSTKNRNYIRRNRNTSLSPEPNQDVDLRLGAPPEKQPRIQGDTIEEKNGSNEMPSQSMDVDLRQLPSMIAKKRPSTESRESPSSKKSKTEMFDVLFGSEDIDLRQLPPVMTSPKGADRPPTPPPPIISDKIEKTKLDISESREKKDVEKKEVPSKNPKLQALRAKLANAVNQDKLKEPKDLGELGSETKKKRSQEDARKLPLFMSRSNIPMDKIIISPADEECIKAGNMTKAQETALMKKIIAQIETQKLREAQRKESESLGNISLQPISDDEFDADFSGNESEDEHQMRTSDDKDKRTNEDRLREDHRLKEDQQKDDQHKEEQYKENRVREDRIPHIPPQVSQLEDTYPKFPRIMDHRDPRRGRPWRGGRHRPKAWDGPPGPMLRPPGMRPPLRSGPGPEPWMRPMNDSWRSMGPPNMYPNNYGPDQIMSNVPPHMIDQGSQSPNSNNHEIPALQYAHPDSYKFITIDGEPREIRYYDETAIVFMSAGDPREITFHNGTRRIFFDGEPFTLKFNHPYEEISLKGNMHRVRLGAPSREIFVDGNGYECYFDSNEKTIELDGNKIVVKLEPPPPQVKIGQEKRIDLVAGKTQLVVDAKNMFTVFLDAKPQVFEIDGTVNTLKFVDALRAVLINDVRFEVEFGGLPKPVMLHDNKHFIRFSVLPKGIRPGHANIKDMEVCQPYESPKIDDENSRDSLPANPISSSTEQSVLPVTKRPFEANSPDRNSNSPHNFQTLITQQNFNNLDMLSSVMASSMVPSSCEGGYMVENATATDTQQEIQPSNSLNVPAAPPREATTKPVININELFQRLVATGIVTTAAPSQPEAPPPVVQPKPVRNPNNFKHLKPLDFSKPETLKGRRLPIIQSLYVGMQCSSCGMRFPPEQSIYYTQHLDWHFRQNRRGKKNIRKASSRRWYYTLSDWTNYQEIEDLEEREKNYFENQQQNQGEGGNEEGEEEIEIPCVLADPNLQTAACEVCQDKFEQFYNEEKDEWQLRMAIRVDDKTYHPLCYEDYQASLVDVMLDEGKTNSTHESDTLNSGIPLLEDANEESHKEEEKLENEEDDVMEVIDNIDDDEPEPSVADDNQKEETDTKEVEAADEDDDVILNEVAPERIVLDDDDDDKDYEPTDAGLIPGVVVKEEPIDDGFIDVGSGLVKMKSDVVKIKTESGDNDEGAESSTTNAAEAADTTHIEVVSTMDGNVELDAGVPASSGLSGKIKINITKPLPAIVPRENRDMVSDDLKADCIDPSQPLPPGEEPVQLNVKPALKGLELKRQPTVKKGSELTGLCSIM